MPKKTKIKRLKQYVKHHFMVLEQRFFNPIVIKQRRNPKLIPIIIINFNQLHYFKLLIESLQNRGYLNIIVIDNNSTYSPLLEYYNTIEMDVVIHRLETNDGHLVFWKQQDLVKKYTKGYYVVTDADIVPVTECPDNFLETFIKLLDNAYDRTKVGFSLRLSNLPAYNPQKKNIKDWESQFWKTKIHPLAYKAEIDTTFALYRPRYTYKKKNFTKAWRTDFPLQAIHGGWYINPNDLTEEQRYYQKTANTSASWLLQQDGQLKSDLHKKTYTNVSK